MPSHDLGRAHPAAVLFQPAFSLPRRRVARPPALSLLDISSYLFFPDIKAPPVLSFSQEGFLFVSTFRGSVHNSRRLSFRVHFPGFSSPLGAFCLLRVDERDQRFYLCIAQSKRGHVRCGLDGLRIIQPHPQVFRAGRVVRQAGNIIETVGAVALNFAMVMTGDASLGDEELTSQIHL